MKRRAIIFALIFLSLSTCEPGWAQNSFRTPNGTVAPGMVPLGTQSLDNNGNPIWGPSPGGGLDVGGKTVSVCVTPTVTASNSYGANYVVGGLLTFANAFTSTGTGILQGVVVTMNDQETSGFTFIPFNANPTNTTWTDAAVAAINAADVTKVRAPISLASNIQLAATLFSEQYAYGLGLPMAPGTTSLYGVLLANAALTNQFAGTGDVQVCVKLLDDE